MNRRCRRVLSERKREQEKHLDAQWHRAVEVGRQPVKPVLAKETVGQSEVISLTIRADFRCQTIGEIEDCVKREDRRKEDFPEKRQPGKRLAL